MSLINRAMLLAGLPKKLRSLKQGNFIECQVDDGGDTYVFIRRDDFMRIAAIAIEQQKLVIGKTAAGGDGNG